MLTVKQLLKCIQAGDWMTSLDHFPILLRHRKYLHFVVGGQSYKYCCLAFEYSLAPCTSTWCVETVLALLGLHNNLDIYYSYITD